MPALTPGTHLWNHIFKDKNNDKKQLSGFHSTALTINARSGELVPKIKRTFIPRASAYGRQRTTGNVPGALRTQVNHGFYLCGWNFYPAKQDPKKWSTMFPNSWGEAKVKDAVTQAIAYWNSFADPEVNGPKMRQENLARLEGLNKKFRTKWVGQAKFDGNVFLIGGLTSQNQATTAFPIMGANENFPRVEFNGQINVDIEVEED